jgi:hypothetical protein
MIDFKTKRGFICDMDGVLYHGNKLLPGATEFIQWLQASNKEYLFLTNNSGFTPRELHIKLLRMGIDVSEEHFYTSALATAEFIRSQNPKASAYVPALALHRNFRIACLKGFIGWIKADRERWAVLDWVYQLLSMLQCCIMRQLI